VSMRSGFQSWHQRAMNAIVELLDAQCNADGNEYVLLDPIVDY
jgi:hypothetical protein